MKLAVPTAAAAVLLFCAPVAFAQTSPGAGAQAAQGLSSADRSYMTSDARGASYEMAISKLALQKSQDASVKKYAQGVIDDHARTNSELEKIAEQNGLKLPSSPDQAQQMKLDGLQKTSGVAFDGAYMDEMRRVNQADLQEEAKEAAATNNAQLEHYLLAVKQADQKHVEQARNIHATTQRTG